MFSQREDNKRLELKLVVNDLLTAIKGSIGFQPVISTYGYRQDACSTLLTCGRSEIVRYLRFLNGSFDCRIGPIVLNRPLEC